MEIGDWKSTGSVALLHRELRQLGLDANIAELTSFGFTVVPPEKVGPPELVEEVREALEKTMLRRYGPDGLAPERWTNVNDIQRFMLWEDRVFERLSYNPAGLGLAQYLLGADCVLSLCAAWVKGPGKIRTGIHGDYLDPAINAQPERVINCNMHFMVTDYTRTTALFPSCRAAICGAVRSPQARRRNGQTRRWPWKRRPGPWSFGATTPGMVHIRRRPRDCV